MAVSTNGLRWYQDAKFGMFVHWGLYALLGRGEWVMFNERNTLDDYPKLAERFNPTRFNADEWVRTAADAGQEYLTITSRHHDGFSMYDTALSPYRVTNTPFGRDPLAELAEACDRHGLRFGVYVSLVDWQHPAFRASRRARSGLAWADYLEFLHGQVRELCTNYGPLGQVWFDGDWAHYPSTPQNEPDWFQPGGDFDYPALYGMIHRLQPDAVVLNNHHRAPGAGEDVQVFEQDLPGENQSGFNAGVVADGPYETCLTINKNWGYSVADEAFKSPEDLIRVLVRAASVDCNLLLNVGPTGDGEIPAPSVERLAAIGRWVRRNGHTVKGTRAGRLGTPPGVVSTRRGETDVVHVLDSSEVGEEFTVSVPDRGDVTVRIPVADRDRTVTSIEL